MTSGPAHSLPTTGSPWRLWRDFALRGTGFAVSLLDDLADPALAQLDPQDPAWDTAHAQADARGLQALRRQAANPRLREALAWQNPSLLSTALAPLLRRQSDGRRNAQDRQHEQLLAAYLQRYAAKNDTIGFFGPVGWAHIEGAGDGLVVQPGPVLADRPAVAVEPWVTQALATALASDPELRPLLQPQRHPAWRPGPDGSVVLLERVLTMPALERALFDHCDGQRRVCELPAALAVPADTLGPALQRLEAARLVSLQPRVPLDGASLAALRQAVCDLPGGGAARLRWLAALDELLAGLQHAQAAFGHGDLRLAALQQTLGTRFQALSGQPPQRGAGNAYAGRTLLVMDARRHVQLHVGEGLARALSQSLRPVLDAAHWFSCQVHTQLDDYVQGLFRQHQRQGLLPLDRLWFDMQRDGGTVQAIVDDVAEQLAERWLTVLPPGDAAADQKLADRAAAADQALAARAAAAFADAAPGWPGARFQAPDVMLAARHADEAATAPFVLGELHAADRSLLRSLFMQQHAQPQRLQAAAEVDQRHEVELWPLMRTEVLLARTRTLPQSSFGFDIECDSVCSPRPRTQVLRSGALWLQQRDGGLHIVDREQGHVFPLHAFFGPQAGALSSNHFALYAPAAHRPRVQAGRLVLARESWRLPLHMLGALLDRRASAARQHAALCRLARDLGWPRHVFYRVAGEPKPIYLDLDSPVYARLFLRTLAAAARRDDPVLDVSEMLPAPDQCWLPDAQGARYACEWRLLFVRDHGR